MTLIRSNARFKNHHHSSESSVSKSRVVRKFVKQIFVIFFRYRFKNGQFNANTKLLYLYLIILFNVRIFKLVRFSDINSFQFQIGTANFFFSH